MGYNSYLPNREADLLNWASANSAMITAQPLSYGLSVPIAASYASAVSEFALSLAACARGVRNMVAVTLKKEKKALLKQNIRAWVAIVNGTSSVTDAQRQELALTVRSMPAPVPIPATPPVIQVKAIHGRTVTVRLRQESTGALRGKPGGTIGATIQTYQGDAPPANVSDWKVAANTGKSVLDITFDSSLPPGATVWLTASWLGTRLESGPACTPISITFGAAGVLVA
jgi:hypothetical protein